MYLDLCEKLREEAKKTQGIQINHFVVDHLGLFATWVREDVGGPLLVGLFLVWQIPRLNQKFQGKREQLAKAVETLRIQLDALRKISSTYWMEAYDPIKSPPQEAEIEFLLQDISALVNACAPDLWRKQAGTGPQLVSQLIAVATGSQFATTVRTANPAQLGQVAQAAAAISTEIVTRRTEFFRK